MTLVLQAGLYGSGELWLNVAQCLIVSQLGWVIFCWYFRVRLYIISSLPCKVGKLVR